VLELKEADNTTLRSEIQSLQNELNRRDHDKNKEVVVCRESNTVQNRMKSDESLSSQDAPASPTLIPDELVEVLRQISARLEAVERGQDREEELIREERQSRESEMEYLRLMVEESCQRRQEILQITQDNNEVEIVLPREEKVATRRKVTKHAAVNTTETQLAPVTREVAVPYSNKKDELSSWCCDSWVSL
jgi:hypothetical protein